MGADRCSPSQILPSTPSSLDFDSEPHRGEWLGVATGEWGSGGDLEVSRRKRLGLGRQVRILEAASVQG